MRRALAAFAASRAMLLLVLVVVPPLTAWEGTERAPLSWRAAGEQRHLYHPWRVLDAWARHDSAYYLQIAMLGYEDTDATFGVKEGFFPGYALAVRGVAAALSPLPGAEDLETRVLLSALLVSNLAAVGALMLLVRLLEPMLGAGPASRAGVVLAVQPFGFLLSAALSEGLFLLLAIASVAALARRRPLWSGVLGGFAAFTRPFGVLLGLPLLAGLRGIAKGRRLDAFLGLAAVPVGLLMALLLIGRATGDPWTWFEIQKGFGHQSFPTLEGFTGLFRLYTFDGHEPWRKLAAVLVLVAAAALCWRLGRLALRGSLPASWCGYAILMLLLPILAGNVISLPRYATAIFPLYAAAGSLVPGGRMGLVLAALGIACQAGLLLVFEAHLPVVV